MGGFALSCRLAWFFTFLVWLCHAGFSMRFNASGEFKIAQFADLHFGEAEDMLWGPEQDVNSTCVMHRVLAWEKPDIVVYSGDQVTGENVDSNATAYWHKAVQPCLDTGTPWAAVFGNHDDRSAKDGTRKDLLLFDTSFKLSLSKFGPANIHGLTNYYLLLYNQVNSKPLWVFYFLDSGGGTYPELVYDDQIEWFKNTSTLLTQQFGSLPSIAFFHIPSTGFDKLYSKSLCFGMDDDEVTPQTQANKLLSVLVSYGGVRGVFIGHDHGNDWCCPLHSHPTTLVCYGRHTGYGGYGRWARGSRVIVLRETSEDIETYVRMEDGSIIDGN